MMLLLILLSPHEQPHTKTHAPRALLLLLLLLQGPNLGVHVGRWINLLREWINGDLETILD